MARKGLSKAPFKRWGFLLSGFFVALSILYAAACTQQKPPAPVDTRAADEQAIRETDIAFSQAASAKDLEKCVSFYADDAQLLGSEKPATIGKEAIREEFTKMFAMPGSAISWQVTKVQAARSGDLGYSTGSFVLTRDDAKGKPLNIQGEYVTVWQKAADGSWKAVADISSPNAPLPPAKEK